MNNNRTINMLEICRKILKRILTHPIRSIQQAALIERIDPDAVTRAIKGFAQYLGGGKLVECDGNLIVLTKLGREGLQLLEQFTLLAENEAQQVEKLRFAISPGIPSDIISLALSRFLFHHGTQVSPEILVVNDGMRDLVRSGNVAFGLDLCVADSTEPDEQLPASIPGSIAIPLDHRLVGAGMIDADHFSSEGDRVFLSSYIAPFCMDLLVRVPAANRIVIPDSDLRHRLVSINAGLAIEFANPSLLPGDAFIRLPVAGGVQAATLGLWMARKGQLSEPAKALISEIRYANLPPITPLDPPGQDESLPELPPLPAPLQA
jgi:hypothetical protein